MFAVCVFAVCVFAVCVFAACVFAVCVPSARKESALFEIFSFYSQTVSKNWLTEENPK